MSTGKELLQTIYSYDSINVVLDSLVDLYEIEDNELIQKWKDNLDYSWLEEKQAEIYDDLYTSEELSKLCEFFKTDLGKKYLDLSTGEVFSRSFEIGQEWSQRAMDQLQEFGSYEDDL